MEKQQSEDSEVFSAGSPFMHPSNHRHINVVQSQCPLESREWMQLCCNFDDIVRMLSHTKHNPFTLAFADVKEICEDSARKIVRYTPWKLCILKQVIFLKQTVN